MNIEDKELEQFRKSQRRKDIIKNITIVFLLILLALTFFSRTIMNYTLPQVATHVVAQGEVSPRIRGQGTAEVDDPYNVMMAQARTIKSVAVRVDQKVKRGDVLYYLEDNESEDLRTARQELTGLQSDFTKKLFDGTLSDADITRLRAGNYRSDDEMQAQLASVNRRLEAATAEATAAKAALDKLTAESSDSGSGSGSGSVTPASATQPMFDPDEEEDDASSDDSGGGGGSSSKKAKKLSKATMRNIDAELELEAAKTQQEKIVGSISSELELKSLQEQINLAQAKVKRMEEENIGASIKSPVDGTVTSLTYSSGEVAAADSSAAIIRVDGKKLTVSFSVSKEQAQKLQVGDQAEPQNYWEYDENFKAVLRQITADSSDPQNSRLLKFEIDSSAVTAGDTVQLQIAESSKTYDLVVPNSAVRNDANGTFVLILQTRQSPLGNRYIVTRESVKVLAKDDTNSAISGSIGAYTYVVTTSTRSISSGDQVRLSEEEESDEN